ncbi:hypothetical protein ACVWZA_002471 [Sphingomonas sp. UYAg733]
MTAPSDLRVLRLEDLVGFGQGSGSEYLDGAWKLVHRGADMPGGKGRGA